MILIYLAPLVMLIGLMMFFAVKNNANVKQIGFAMFCCGLLVTLYFTGARGPYHLP